MKKNIVAIFLSMFLLSIMFRIQFIVPADASTTYHPAQSMWVKPSFINLRTGGTFTVDVMINVTDPEGPATGLYGFEYKLLWNSTVLQVLDIQYHNPFGPGWAMVVKNITGVLPDGRHYHWLSIAIIIPGPAYTGVMSVCTYTFHCRGVGESVLNLTDTILVDDTATLLPYSVNDGYVICQPPSGDINGDKIIDIVDLVIATVAFGSQQGDPNWNPDADLNDDDLIDICDLVIIGVNFGKTW